MKPQGKLFDTAFPQAGIVEVGFEPTKLAQRILSPPPLTTRKLNCIHFLGKSGAKPILLPFRKREQNFARFFKKRTYCKGGIIPVVGIEPTAFQLKAGYSTTKLHRCYTPFFHIRCGARTRNLPIRSRTRYPFRHTDTLKPYHAVLY